MKTEDLISILAEDTRPVRAGLVQRRLATFTGAGLCGSVLLLLTWLPPRPDLAAAMGGTVFWAKSAYTLSFALAGALAVERLARPGGRTPTATRGLLALAVGLMALAAVIGLSTASPDQRLASWLGDSSKVCSLRIIVLAIPLLIAALAATRSLAPTRLRAAGAAAGLLAGGLSATVYALHCPESTPAFIVCWYSLGMVACGAIGAALGPVALRWR
jgi:hypothetical protein